MSVTAVENVRNFVILGHSGSGKTTLTDAIAFKIGLNDRLGLVSNGSSVSDITDEEKARKISIFSSPFTGEYKLGGQSYKLIFTDTPGAPDFYGQLRGAVRAADSAIITVDAVSGVQVGTRRAWHICKSYNLSSVGFVITGLDKENADFHKVLNAIRDAFGVNCVPVTVPVAADKIVNILDTAELPAELEDIKTSLAEAAAETDEALMDKYFSEGTLSAEEIRSGLLAGIAGGSVRPIYCVLSLKGTGLPEMLDSVCRLLPGPGKRPLTDADGNALNADPAAPFVAQVWKTAVDPFMGQLSYIRVFSGTLTNNMAVQNNTNGGRETVTTILQVNGKKQTGIDSAGPGDIVALPKLKNTKTGDTLAAVGTNTKLPEIDYPQPVTYMAVTAKTQADEDKISVAIHRLLDSDPTIHYEKQAATKEIILKGLGDVHLDVAVALMKSQSNVNVLLSTPKVPYREAVTGKGQGHYRHKKQSGGRGQFGEVYLRVEALPEGETEWFLDETVGGSIPGNFMPAIQKGINETMLAGPIAGYPVQNVKVHVYDGAFHEVDSSEVAFKIAGSRAFREGMMAAKPVLLEPIMTLKISIPDTFMGAISGDMPHKRGRVLGMEADEDGVQVITAEAPLAELFKYSAELRSLTGGQGSFTMDFARYDVVPGNVAQKIIAEAAKNRQEEED
ncbi:MAG: elongation factor G [Kiritimatiellae bacterium]|nr:elongation factor G [Kiritimatiellia bacterium]